MFPPPPGLDGKVSMACQGVSRVLCCRFGVTSSNSCRPFVSILAGISQIHTRQALQGSGNLSWEHGRLNNQLTQLLLATLHIFYLFELIYYVVKAILFVESQRAI